jgi:hypothetical protein
MLGGCGQDGPAGEEAVERVGARLRPSGALCARDLPECSAFPLSPSLPSISLFLLLEIAL